MMTTFKKKLVIQGSIAFLSIAVLSIGIAIFSGDIEQYGKNFIAAKEELAKRTNSLSMLANLQTQYNKKAKDYMLILEESIPMETNLFNISRDFQVLATQSGVEQTFAFTGESRPSGGTLGSVNFRLQAVGEAENLQLFIKNLEQFRYITRIESLSIGRTKDGLSTASVRGQIYFRTGPL